MSAFADLLAYARASLAFDYAGRGPDAPAPAPPAQDDLERMLARVLAAFGRSGRARLALLGLGSGALASALAVALPPGVLCVCEQDLGLARALAASGALPWWTPEGPAGPAGLAADASPWALFCLLERAGFGPGAALALPNPELPPASKAALKPLELLLARSKEIVPPQAPPLPKLSAAAILSPSEPDLEGFFAQFPDWLHELVLVWDAEVLPDIPAPERIPLRQLARPLGHDFSAQRNAMLAACTGDWTLYLDADERLSPLAWARVPGLCALPEATSWRFPRLTPHPDAEHALVGFGLWPDVQLRLFRNAPGLNFVNPVHERLEGLGGGQGLALGVEIEHLSRLRKGEAELKRKLAGFDAAGGGAVRHALSAEYPSVPRSLVSFETGAQAGARCLLLPPELG